MTGPYRIESVRVQGRGMRSVFKPCLMQGDHIVAEFYGHGPTGQITDADRKRAREIMDTLNKSQGSDR